MLTVLRIVSRFLSRKKRAPVIVDPDYFLDETVVVAVDYDLSLAESIVAAKLKEVNDEIVPGFFPNKRSGKKELRFAVKTFEQDSSTEYVLEQFEKCGLRPATVEELLAFWVYWSQKAKLWQCVIVALGSNGQSIHDGVVAPSIDGKRRWLRHARLEGKWSYFCRFLAVHKDTPQ